MINSLIVLLLLAILVWLWYVDRKTDNPPVFYITVNIDGDQNVKRVEKQGGEKAPSASKTKKEIPIEVPKKADDWLNINPTDSNL